MTIRCAACFDKGKFRNLEPEKLEPLRKKLKQGEAITIIVTDQVESAADKRMRLFHEIVDRYARTLGYTKDTAKVELKMLHGTSWERFEQIPDGTNGKVVSYHGERFYLKSITRYTADEWHALIDGSLQTCIEAQVDVADILEGVR